MKVYYVYILASKKDGTLYIGLTNNLERRIYEHKNSLVEGFTRRYKIKTLVYFEQTNSIQDAISREKQLKGLLRRKKVDLIEGHNPNWEDLEV